MYKDWLLTVFASTFVPPTEGLEYAAYQKEKCSTTSRLHFQVYLRFQQRKRFSTVQKLYPGAHIERAMDPKKARAYCMKEDTRVEGPHEVGQWMLEAKTNLVEMVKRRRVLEVITEVPTSWRNFRTLCAIRDACRPERDWPTQALLFTGSTGTGKTRTANLIAQYLGSNYWAESTLSWFDGYDGEPLMIVDEFRGQCTPEFILRFLDRYPMRLPVKGGFTQMAAHTVILTSNLHLADMFMGCDVSTRNAIARRVVELKF